MSSTSHRVDPLSSACEPHQPPFRPWKPRALVDQLPIAGLRGPNSTYLAWIDISHYLGPNVDRTLHFAKASVLIEGAVKFVSDGDGCIRVNVASPRTVADEGLRRIIAA